MKNRGKVEYELTVVFRKKTFKLTNNWWKKKYKFSLDDGYL